MPDPDSKPSSLLRLAGAFRVLAPAVAAVIAAVADVVEAAAIETVPPKSVLVTKVEAVARGWPWATIEKGMTSGEIRRTRVGRGKVAVEEAEVEAWLRSRGTLGRVRPPKSGASLAANDAIDDHVGRAGDARYARGSR